MRKHTCCECKKEFKCKAKSEPVLVPEYLSFCGCRLKKKIDRKATEEHGEDFYLKGYICKFCHNKEMIDSMSD